MVVERPKLPPFQTLRRLKYTLNLLRDLPGVFSRECPICGFAGKFSAQGRPPRYDARCPQCGSFERHRLFALSAAADPSLVTSTDRVLHFAPEPSLRAVVERVAGSYESADLRAGVGTLQLNIEQLELPDECFDVVIASHVLEHVDDQRALREIYRVLRPGGRLIAMVPIVEGWSRSHEDAKVVAEFDRVLHFGQEDHVRYYGRDFRARITAASFELVEFCGSAEQCARYGLVRGETVFVGRKASGSDAAHHRAEESAAD